MNEKQLHQLKDGIQDLIRAAEERVSDDLLSAYLQRNIQRATYWLRYDKNNVGLIRLRDNAIFYKQCVESGSIEYSILRLHEKVEIAALIESGLSESKLTDVTYELDEKAFLRAHIKAIESEVTFIDQIKSELLLHSPVEYLLIAFPFYCHDLMRENGGTAIADRFGRLFANENFNEELFLAAMKEYQLVGFNYPHQPEKMLEQFREKVLARSE